MPKFCAQPQHNKDLIICNTLPVFMPYYMHNLDTAPCVGLYAYAYKYDLCVQYMLYLQITNFYNAGPRLFIIWSATLSSKLSGKNGKNFNKNVIIISDTATPPTPKTTSANDGE